jgi:uncharacterized protein (DUF983 family)
VLPSAPPGTKIWRGLRRRCGRCGAKGIFETYFRLRARCPSCGYQFERETGFWMGVYLLNYAVTGAVLVAIIVVGLVASGGESYPTVPVLVSCLAVAIVLPLVFYPFAKSLWAALDLAMRPLDPVEEAEAALYAEDAGDS